MPPVDSMVDNELSSLGRCMFGIIIMNESVPIWIEFLNHWQKCLLKYANIGNCIHASFEDANTESAFLADGGPHMHLLVWVCTWVSDLTLYSRISDESLFAL